MAGFDVFVLPSRYEAFPYVYLEALARNLPIISTDVGGAGAVVDEGINGYVIAQSRLEQLPARIASLASNPELRKTMSEASGEKSSTKTAAIMVDRTVAVYEQLLKA
jgi:glycosyltransferase involved in cell wall biosynthesis